MKFLLILLSLSSFGQLIGKKNIPKTATKVYVYIALGQSQIAGRAQSTRLSNTDYNYKGIAAGYPTVRSGQAQYSKTPSNVKIYKKPAGNSLFDHSADNGSWTDYNSDNNACTDGTAAQFAAELSASVSVADYTGLKVYIIKPAFGSTALDPSTASSNPSHNYLLSDVAGRFWIERGLRDLRTLEPSAEIVLLPIDWGQGEADASFSVTKTQYKTDFYIYKKRIESSLRKYLSMPEFQSWTFTKLHFNLTAGETVINSAFNELITEIPNTYLINIDSYPRKIELTSAQATPLTRGTPINSEGGDDDNHGSYISMLAKGELYFAICRDYGYLTPR